MYVLHSTKAYFFDVDRTLVFTDQEVGAFEIRAQVSLTPVMFGGREFFTHENHIRLMKDLKARGHSVVVWSAGGGAWAEQVVRKLGLESVVDAVMTKPDGICDDKSVEEWLPEVDRFYIPIGEFTGGK